MVLGVLAFHPSAMGCGRTGIVESGKASSSTAKTGNTLYIPEARPRQVRDKLSLCMVEQKH
jgi:hypothetical protein